MIKECIQIKEGNKFNNFTAYEIILSEESNDETLEFLKDFLPMNTDSPFNVHTPTSISGRYCQMKREIEKLKQELNQYRNIELVRNL